MLCQLVYLNGLDLFRSQFVVARSVFGRDNVTRNLLSTIRNEIIESFRAANNRQGRGRIVIKRMNE